MHLPGLPGTDLHGGEWSDVSSAMRLGAAAPQGGSPTKSSPKGMDLFLLVTN